MRIACETYAWLMPGEKYQEKLDHIMTIVSKAEFEGIEPVSIFLNPLSDPAVMAEHLKKNNLKLAAMALICDWLEGEETEAERAHADAMIALIKQHEGAVLMACQMPTTRPDDAAGLVVRQDNMLSCIHAVAKRAKDAGIAEVSYHPNSPDTSIWRTPADYDRCLPLLNGDLIGWTPDVGHMANGDVEVLKYMKAYRSIINHVHFKDMFADKKWAMMGEGIIDFEAIIRYLVETNYNSWLVIEDECAKAEVDPDAVTLEIGEYIKKKILPLLP